MESEKHRIDLWLKLVCLFKHRADATEACKGGKVQLNGQRCKPSATIRAGDVVEIVGEERYRKVVALEFPDRSIAKEEARTMYRDETPPPTPGPPRSANVAGREKGAGRPTKRERREIDRWRR